MSDESLETVVATEAPVQTETQASVKTYSQQEFDNHMAGLKKSLTAKFEKQLGELGDLDELKQLKANAEAAKQEEAIKRGEFEKILQEMAAKKDGEILKRDKIIEEYKVNTPLLNAAAKYKSVSPEQVQNLLRQRVRLGESGDAEVLDESGAVRYDDSGNQMRVDDFVKEWLDQNPHFVQPGNSTTNTKSAVAGATPQEFNLASLDLTRPEHRQAYKDAMKKGIIQ
jgi:hypothetical protein